MRGRAGSFTFICPAGGSFYAVTGTGTYADSSSICTAAVHAGVITRAAGGTVTVTPNSGTASYAGTTARRRDDQLLRVLVPGLHGQLTHRRSRTGPARVTRRRPAATQVCVAPGRRRADA
ncbi:LCCL domain-containing protein [Phytohabitans flavus]|uniref:LCCL domain-containing protein n=1 Tax=Phytohabitans flavus TaxID=1076124 RepID=UPI003629F5AF